MVLAVAWSWGFRLNLPTAHVPVPSSRAAPDEVVRAYVEAYNHRDFRTVAELYPSRPIDGFLPRHRGLGTMNDLRISTSGPDTTYGPDSAYWAVGIRIRFSGLAGSDLSYDDGPTGWTYYLQQTGPDHAWRIADHGTA